MLVKLPAIFADLAVGVLLYATVRRFAATGIALGAAALYLLNPAVVFISASWGQVDSISGGLALLAVYALLRSEDFSVDARAHAAWIVAGWLAFGYSLLIKPQAAVLLPLLVAFAFVDPARRRARLTATGIGIVAALLLALLIAEPFHPSNPVAAFGWLLQRYAFGSNVYPYNTVNAFNLWALRGTLWVADSQNILFLPQYVWGSAPRVRRVGAGRLALRPEPHVRGVARSLRDRHARLLRARDADARTLPLQRRPLYDCLHSVRAALRLRCDCALDRALREPSVQPAVPARGHRGHAGRQRAEPVGPLDDVLFAGRGRGVLRARLSVFGGQRCGRRRRAARAQAPGAGRREGAGLRGSAPLVRSARRPHRDARAARLHHHGAAGPGELHPVVRRLLVAGRQGVRRDLLRASGRRVSAEHAYLREHASAAEQAARSRSR